MKIAFITEFFYPHVGGQEVRYLELGRELAREGNVVHVYTLRLTPDQAPQENVEGMEVHRITDGFRYKRASWLRRNPIDIVRFTLGVLKRIRGTDFRDVLIINLWPVLPAMLVPRLATARSVVDWCEIRQSLFWRSLYRLVAGRAALHIAVSNSIAEHLRRRYAVSGDRVATVLSGIHCQNYQTENPKKQDRMILFLGRLSPHKDPLIALRSFMQVALHKKGYELHFVGEGPLFTELKRVSNGVENVFVHGAVNEVEKVRLLKQSTLLVLPSKREGFPRVIAEAAAAGTPTLTTVHPENGSVSVVRQYGLGWVCTPKPSEIGVLMERHAQMGEEWMKASYACVEAARSTFDWKVVTHQLTKFLEASQ